MSWGGLGILGSPSSFFLRKGKSTQGSGIWVLTKDPTPLYPQLIGSQASGWGDPTGPVLGPGCTRRGTFYVCEEANPPGISTADGSPSRP